MFLNFKQIIEVSWRVTEACGLINSWLKSLLTTEEQQNRLVSSNRKRTYIWRVFDISLISTKYIRNTNIILWRIAKHDEKGQHTREKNHVTCLANQHYYPFPGRKYVVSSNLRRLILTWGGKENASRDGCFLRLILYCEH